MDKEPAFPHRDGVADKELEGERQPKYNQQDNADHRQDRHSAISQLIPEAMGRKWVVAIIVVPSVKIAEIVVVSVVVPVVVIIIAFAVAAVRVELVFHVGKRALRTAHVPDVHAPQAGGPRQDAGDQRHGKADPVPPFQCGFRI